MATTHCLCPRPLHARPLSAICVAPTPMSTAADGQAERAFDWSDKDISLWVRLRLMELLQNQRIMEAEGGLQWRTATMSRPSGECKAYVRKGRLVYDVDVNFSVEWVGETVAEDGKKKGSVGGKFTIPQVSLPLPDAFSALPPLA